VKAELEGAYGERSASSYNSRHHTGGLVADLKAHVECLKLLLDCIPTPLNTAMLEQLRLSYTPVRAPHNNTDEQIIEQRLLELQQDLRGIGENSGAHAEYLAALRVHRGAAENSVARSEELRGLAERWSRFCEERVALTEQLQGDSFKTSLRYCTHFIRLRCLTSCAK
jgi:hypothetical protein